MTSLFLLGFVLTFVSVVVAEVVTVAVDAVIIVSTVNVAALAVLLFGKIFTIEKFPSLLSLVS